MIGTRYWATGIMIDHKGGDEWTASLDFYDDGFTDLSSTQGKLTLRYVVPHAELDEQIDVLIKDAKKLGIELDHLPDGPTIYIHADGEDEGRPDNDRLLREAIHQCERLGWRTLYELTD